MTHSGPADRYYRGRRRGGWRTSRWTPIVLGVVVVLLGIGVAFLGYQRFGAKPIDPGSASYTAVDDSTMNIQFTLTRQDPSRPVDCIVRARSKDGTETGRREVFVPASSSGTVQVDTTLRTSRPPAIGDVYGCSFDIPGYLQAD